MTASRTIAGDGRAAGPTRPGPGRGDDRRAVAAARAAARLAGRRRCCSARCCSARSRSSPTRLAPVRGRGRRPDRVADPAVGRGGRLPRGHPARPVRAVARARPSALTWFLVVADARARGADPPRPRSGLTADDRTAVLVTILLVAFIGFTGVAAMVPGGLVQPGRARAPCPRATCWSSPPATRLIAGLLGYRAVALRVPEPARRALVGPDLRGGHRDRRGGPAGDGDPAAGRTGAPDARVLPVGRAPPARRRRAAATRAGCGRSCCWPALGIVVVAWNLLLRA